jgi:FlaA1/EpsC-like NDP-sugar epimerase
MPHGRKKLGLGPIRNRIVGWQRSTKRRLLQGADFLLIPLCLWASIGAKFDSPLLGLHQPALLYVAAAAGTVIIFQLLGLYRAITRFIDFRSLVSVSAGAICSSLLVWLLARLLKCEIVTATVAFGYGLNVLVLASSARILARWALSVRGSSLLPVIIYGAGEAGAQLAIALRAGGRMYPVAYVDEKSALHGSTVGSVRVVPPDALRDTIRDYDVSTVLLAIPGASRRRRSEIIRQMVDFGVHVQTVPDLNDIVSGKATLADLRDVSIEDLLGRDPVTPQSRLLGTSIRGKRVMVTGAGGSIGSELCRQILHEQPSVLVLFELSEIALYDIERELSAIAQQRALKVELVPLLGNTQHRSRMREVMQACGVQTVYHAAAYKHVPIVEQNVVEGIYNNVFATWNAAEAAVEAGAETFVLVSTDKAVHPTNVMGATKRLAEIVLQAIQTRQQVTRFCMVRFGNVLGSSGSVVPLFSEQIRMGGPVTVTHPEVRRYFMTIPEAASLVLQASAMAKGGEVFVLDMGQAVKIDELARRMIALSGLTVRDEANPDGDIAIEYSGLRPAEKLFEELLIGDNVSGTEHPMVMRAYEHAPAWQEVQEALNSLWAALGVANSELAKEILAGAVSEYQPAERMHDLVWNRHMARVESAAPQHQRRSSEATVIPLRVVTPN